MDTPREELAVPVTQQWTIGRLLQWSKEYLQSKRVESPRLSVELLLAHALHCKKIDLYLRIERVPTEEERGEFRELLLRAAEHAPIAHLIGKKEFYSIEFEVSPAVLIPRPETELLVEKVIQHVRALPQLHVAVLDLGTGSGCVGLALCRHLPQVRVTGTDVSEEALAVARSNAERLGLNERFVAVGVDGFDFPPESIPTGGWDMLVSNPPYVAENETSGLDENVRRYEPSAALFGGMDGLKFYRLMADRAETVLKPRASVWVEIGAGQHESVVKLMTESGRYKHVETFKDLNEGHSRVVRFDRIER